jgi:hypothetical protein
MRRRCIPVLALLFWVGVATPAVEAQTSDTTPPTLAAFALTPAAIDVTLAPQTVTVTLRVTDDLSGVPQTCCPVQLSFRSPSGQQNQQTVAMRQSGTSLDSVWTAEITFPQFVADGLWEVGHVYLVDAVGNTSYMSSPDLLARGFPITLSVTSIPDTTPPQLQALSFAPASVDTSLADQSIAAVLRVTDALAGIRSDCCPVQLRLASPTGKQFTDGVAFLDPVSSNWETVITFPRYSEPGAWTVAYVFLTDVIGNMVFLQASDLGAAGFPSQIQVASSPSDTSVPQLTSLTLSHALIDTSASDQTVDVVLGVTDDLAGLRPDCCPVQVMFRSASGGQVQWAVATLDTGTTLNGVWRGLVTFPRFSESGTWKVAFVYLQDVTTNLDWIDTPRLEASGFASQIVVIKPSLETDGTIEPGAGGTVQDETFGDRAQVTVPAGVFTEDTDVAIDVFSEPLDIPIPTGFSADGTRFVNIGLDPTPAFPLAAPGLTIVLPLVQFEAPGTVLWLYRVDSTTGLLEPAIDIAGQPIAGTVDAPDGMSATFTGVSRLSTVVGLRAQIQTVHVTIDIAPLSRTNVINAPKHGLLPVAIITTSEFDASLVDPRTVKIGGAGILMVGKKDRPIALRLDVDRDGDRDLVVVVRLEDLDLAEGANLLMLEGLTSDGRRIEGEDTVTVKGKKKPGRR